MNGYTYGAAPPQYDAYGNLISAPPPAPTNRPPSEEQKASLQTATPGTQQAPQMAPPQQTASPGTNPVASAATGAGSGIGQIIQNLMRARSQGNQSGYVGYIYPNQSAAAQAGDLNTGPQSGENLPTGAGAGGMSQAGKNQAGLGLISQASQAGNALEQYGANANWRMQPSAIPDPEQFISQEQRQNQEYDFNQQPIV